MTPKPYDIQWVDADKETGEFRLVGNPETFYGPYLAANTYKTEDAWSVRLKFNFKFQQRAIHETVG